MTDIDRSAYPGTIENTRKMLAFLEEMEERTPAAGELIRRYRAEIEGYEYAHRAVTQVTGPDGHDHDLHSWEDDGGALHPSAKVDL